MEDSEMQLLFAHTLSFPAWALTLTLVKIAVHLLNNKSMINDKCFLIVSLCRSVAQLSEMFTVHF